jgi:hypothetical protein
MGIMTCPLCKGEKVVSKETGRNIDFKLGVTSDAEPVECPDSKGKGHLEANGIW